MSDRAEKRSGVARIAATMALLFACTGSAAGARAADETLSAELRAGKAAWTAPDRVSPVLRATLADRSRAEVGRSVRFDADGRVHVYVHARGATPVAALAATLAEHGVRVEQADARRGIVQAWVPASRVDEIAGLDSVERVEPPSYATVRAGSVTTAGDSILRADALRALGFTGRNARVGVISDGANARADAIASGDLPGDVTVLSECDPSTSGGTCNEGTAMMEIVHDLAPDAKLAFCSGLTTVSFESCVADLRGGFGANVIVDDLGFFSEPYFEDGAVAQAVQSAVEAGVVYASAAGNDALSHYEADFVGVTGHFTDSNGAPLPEHDFGAAAGGASDTTLDLTIPPGGVASVFLQWNDPFGSSANDYDLVLLSNDEKHILLQSQNRQNGNDDPFESLVFPNQLTRTATVKLAVVKIAGEDRRIQLFLQGDIASHQYNVADGSIVGHPAVSGVLAAGAISASDPGNADIESFSSRGPAQIFFPSQESRPKPDVAGIDGVAVTGAGGFPTPFFGTSAAAPHVAGVAALLIGGVNTPSEIEDALRGTAIDLGDAGFDSSFGFGRVDALAAETRLNAPPNAVIVSPSADLTVNVGGTVTFTGTCNDPEGLPGSTFHWSFGDPAIADSTAASPGDVTFGSAGAFTVSFACTDALGATDPSPATRVVTVAAPHKSGGGGGCAVAREAGGAASPAGLALALCTVAMGARRSRTGKRKAALPPGRSS